MSSSRFAGLVIGALMAAGCAAESTSLWDYKDVDVDSRLNVSFDGGDIQFIRTEAKNNRNKAGWVEIGTWQAEDESGISSVWIFVTTLFTQAFMKENTPRMPDLARDVSGNSYVEVLSEGQIESNSGAVDYIFYRTGGQACVLLRKYWSDPRLSSDASRIITWQWIAGTNLVRAYYCKSGGNQLTHEDLKLLKRGITATGLYWPDNIFLSTDEQFEDRGAPTTY